MDIDELKYQVASIKWWHQIDLGHGIVTPGLDRSAEKLRTLRLPGDLSGMSVLDVGAWDGFFSFECERRGASRVLAVDSYIWSGVQWGGKAGFNLARKALNSRVEDMNLDVLDISPDALGSFDVVLFLGVLYHMRHPLLALECVASVTRQLLVLETHLDAEWSNRPGMVFYPESELREDSTNWWGPNARCVEAMLRDVGFPNVKKVWKRAVMLRLASAVKHRMKYGTPLLYGLQQNRAVFHARH